MIDKMNTQGQPDVPASAPGESYELIYIAEKMHTTVEHVKEAIRIVGNNRGYIEAYLKR